MARDASRVRHRSLKRDALRTAHRTPPRPPGEFELTTSQRVLTIEFTVALPYIRERTLQERRAVIRSRNIVPFVVAFVAACGQSPATSQLDAGDDASQDGSTPIDSGTDEVIAPDVEDDVEPDIADDVSPIDVGSDAGDAGAPCSEDADCDSLLCIDITPGDDQQGFCSQPCVADDSCPEGFDCVIVTGSVDSERICVPVDLCIDGDDDGFGVGPGCDGPDCDDEDDRAYFGRNEVCDDVDNDCDGTVDDAPSDANEPCETGSLGECAAGRTACETGLLSCQPLSAPTTETCDTRDNDCDGSVDEDELGAALSRSCYDGDPALNGVGICTGGTQTCNDGGFSGCLGQQLPLAELCNGLDDDCDGAADDGLATDFWYPDVDGDGFGDLYAEAVEACGRPEGYVENSSDCDDSETLVRPGAVEFQGDGIDQNCDGIEACYEDSDLDGFRRTSVATILSLDEDCDDPGEAYVDTPADDCDDDEPASFPGNAEVCDDLDNDCDSRVDEGAACYPNGDECLDPTDCASGLCEDGICVRPLTCVDLGTCPPRTTTSGGGGRIATGRFVLDLSAGAGTSSPVLGSPRFRMTVGPAPYVSDP
jgi:hypothetical protein